MKVEPSETKKDTVSELVVNWHLTQACNYRCYYCYASWSRPAEAHAIWKDSHKTYQMLSEVSQFFAPNNQSNRLSSTMKWSGLRLSLAGGEPMILGERFKQIVSQAEDLAFKLSLITNGSFLTHEVLGWLSPRLSMLGISIDASDTAHNKRIGRQDSTGRALAVEDLATLVCHARRLNPNLIIKINTVVNRYNWDQDLRRLIHRIQPDRWKILRVLPLISSDHAIKTEQFLRFLDHHSSLSDVIAIEDNLQMQDSYIMIDPYGRFYQNSPSSCGDNGYCYSDRILDIGVERAFGQIQVSTQRFAARYQQNSRGVAA